MANIAEIEKLLRAGIHYQNEQDEDRALENYDQVLSYIPDQIDALYFKSRIFLNRFDYQKSKTLLEKALGSSNPSIPASTTIKCLTALGFCYQKLEKHQEAFTTFEKASLLDPSNPDLAVDVIQSLLVAKKTEEALSKIEKWEKKHPTHTRILVAKAEVQFRQWDVLGCFQTLQKALKTNPTNLDLVSQYLMTSNYLPDENNLTTQEHIKLGTALNAFFRKSFEDQFPPSPSKNKKLKIGFISGDFKTHSVAYFLLPLLSFLQKKEHVEVYCYSTIDYQDATTDRIIELSDHFTKLRSSREFQGIKEDSIDILIDLAAHTNSKQFESLVCNPKLCPVYVSWLGYPNTSGFPVFDYRFVDNRTDPTDSNQEPITEKRVYLSPSFLCYSPPLERPKVKALPLLKNGYLTLGSFNFLNKVNDQVLKLWIKILKEIPFSKLLIKNALIQNPTVKNKIHTELQHAGVDCDRLILENRIEGLYQHLDFYNNVDISLDTFPYSGTTTSFESLLMGCPVVTMKQNNHRSRVTASILEELEMDDWIATSEEEYLEVIQSKLSARKRLAETRSGLRQKLLSSKLCDSDHFGAEFLNACQRIS